MGIPHKQLKTAAIRFLQRQPRAESPLELPELLGRCQIEMVQRFKIPLQDAYDLAIAAWSEVEGRRGGDHFALEISTPWLVFVVDPFEDRVRPVPIVDLLDYLNTPPAERPPAGANLRLVHDADADPPAA